VEYEGVKGVWREEEKVIAAAEEDVLSELGGVGGVGGVSNSE